MFLESANQRAMTLTELKLLIIQYVLKVHHFITIQIIEPIER